MIFAEWRPRRNETMPRIGKEAVHDPMFEAWSACEADAFKEIKNKHGDEKAHRVLSNGGAAEVEAHHAQSQKNRQRLEKIRRILKLDPLEPFSGPRRKSNIRAPPKVLFFLRELTRKL